MKIVFDLKEFQDWLETLGCDYCTMGWFHVGEDGIYFKWESNINGVITKYDDKQLNGKKIGEPNE